MKLKLNIDKVEDIQNGRVGISIAMGNDNFQVVDLLTFNEAVQLANGILALIQTTE